MGGKIVVPAEGVGPPVRKRKPNPAKELERAQRRDKVVALKSTGMSWREIGNKLGISGVTAKSDFMKVLDSTEMGTVRKAARYARHHMADKLIKDWMREFQTAKTLDAKALAHDKILSAARFQARLLGLELKGAAVTAQQSVNVTVALDKPLQALDESERERLMGELGDLDPAREIEAAEIEEMRADLGEE